MIRNIQNIFISALLKKETELASEDDIHKYAVVSKMSSDQDLESLIKWSQEMSADPAKFFTFEGAVNVAKSGTQIKFDSPIKSLHSENNVVMGDFYPSKKSKAAVIILGHWNAPKESYIRLAKIYSRFGINALRLSLPYHDERRPKSMPIASGLLSSNLTLTIQSFQQSVLEARMAVSWLKSQGINHVGIVGASIGSAISLLIAANEPSIKAYVGYLAADDIAEILWNGSATQHIKLSLEEEINLNILKKVWACINPGSYLEQLARPDFSMHVSYAKFDTACPAKVTQKMLVKLRRLNVPVSYYGYPCGHCTLATFPFIQIAGMSGINFMKKKLLISPYENPQVRVKF
ncbi:MAG: alpha/beta hydrolase family protein [Bacteriovoracaceae bacterium]|nr:alpha/beta hydrolase family protein [Bacteriovoracaceae bacterium]